MAKPSTKKKNSPFAAIDSRSAALEAIQMSAIAFVLVGVIQGVFGAFISLSLLYDAALFIGLGLLLSFLKSRIVALVLLPLSVIMLVFTVLNSAGLTNNGGSNVFLGLVVCWAALRAVEATFKLHGRFAHEPDEVKVEAVTAVDPPQQTKPRLTMLEWGLLVLALLLVMVLLVVILLLMG